MTAPLLHPVSAKSPIEWARAEAVALERHADRMEASHGPRTKGAPRAWSANSRGVVAKVSPRMPISARTAQSVLERPGGATRPAFAHQTQKAPAQP